MANRTSRLLNSQAMNLDVVDVIELVPSDWPVSTMSSFLARSFRRTLHIHHEGRIVKAIASGQNLEVVERTHLILREEGAVIEEAIDDDDEDGGNEKDLNEKADFDHHDQRHREVTEIRVGQDSHDISQETSSLNTAKSDDELT